MGDEGEVVAIERHEGRAASLRETCARMKAGIVDVRVGDAKDPPVEGLFDRVLVDPPCTGLGTLRSHPDLRWRVVPSAVGRLAAEQDAILAAARRHLRPGGRLVYSVCTLSPGEERLAGCMGHAHRWLRSETLEQRHGSDDVLVFLSGWSAHPVCLYASRIARLSAETELRTWVRVADLRCL
jgi:16S rRNA C967 or C1407 C5-methylase (RsmB/RsmF family)